MTPDKIANQLRQDASAYSEGFADGYRLAKKALITCNDCKKWRRDDGTFPDFDGKEWHECSELDAFTSASGDSPVTPAGFYCGNAERR